MKVRAVTLIRVTFYLALFSLSLQVAVAGCCHGHLDNIYATLLRAQEREGVFIVLLLCMLWRLPGTLAGGSHAHYGGSYHQ